jgi:predicted dehydrogenase
MNIGVLGCGFRIRSLLKKLLEINSTIKIVSVYDPDLNSINKFKKDFIGNIKICKTEEELISDQDITWVFIGSYNSFHKEQIIKSIKANKNIFCEKPITINIRECMEVKSAYQNKELNFIISYPLRYSNHYKKIKELINKKEIGNIISLEFNEVIGFNHGAFIMSDWRRFKKYSGGFLLEKCCHDFDLINWLIEDIPKKVASFGGRNIFIEKNNFIYPDLQIYENTINNNLKSVFNPFLSDKDIIDNQVAILEYRNGIRATFHTNSGSSIPERRMYICGTKGTIRADLLTGRIEIRKLNSKEIEIFTDELNKESHGRGDLHLMEELNKIILNQNIIKKEVDDSIKSVITCLAVDYARENGEIISLERIWKEFDY